VPNPSRAFRANRLLATLSDADCKRLARHLTPLEMPSGTLLNEIGARQTYAYFPLDCMVSNVAVIDGRKAIEVGIVGREGVVGVALSLGIKESPARAIVQAKGTAVRIPAEEFMRAMAQNPALQKEVHRYAYVTLAMAMLIAGCNKAHGLQPRLARWLLMTRDCLSTNTYEITQEFLGQMLGARRPSVNLAASALQRRHLISYKRGVLKLLDIPALQATACVCYDKMRQLTADAAESN
jgi:CRP-like cAMP-binding protein